MNLLVVAYAMPPALLPQSIQIGRLLAFLSPRFQLHMISADDQTAPQDPLFYAQLRPRYAAEIRRVYASSGLLKWLRRVMSVALPIPDNFLWWHLAAERQVLAHWSDKPFDWVLSFACPMSSCILGWRLKRRFGLPWMAFLSDPWTNNPYFRQRGPARWINQWMERKTFDDADLLVMPSLEMKARYDEKYPQHRAKIRVLPHSFDRHLYPPPQPRGEGPLRLRYIGNFYGQRSAASLLEAIAMLHQTGVISPQDLQLEIIGGMPQRFLARYLAQVAKLGVGPYVQLKGGVPHLRSLELMAGADVVVLIDADIAQSPFFPSKLADYMGAGRPIFAITPEDGASARILRQVGGWVVPPNQATAIADGIKAVIDASRAGRLMEFAPAQSAEYEVENTVKILEAWLAEKSAG